MATSRFSRRLRGCDSRRGPCSRRRRCSRSPRGRARLQVGCVPRRRCERESCVRQSRVVDLRIPSGKPGIEGAKALAAYAAIRTRQHHARFVLASIARRSRRIGSRHLPRTARLRSTRIERDGALPQWIAARLARQKQRASRETLAFLADVCEGNLLAARQEIEKLALLLPEGDLDHAAVAGRRRRGAIRRLRAIGGLARRRRLRVSCASCMRCRRKAMRRRC